MRCARPPFWRGLWLFRADSGRDLGFWAGFGLGCPSDSEETLSSPEMKSRVIKPESHPTLKRRHSASGSSRETVRTRFRTREPSPRNLWPTNRQSSLRDDRDSFEILSSDKHTEGRAGRDHPIDDSEWSERRSSRAS